MTAEQRLVEIRRIHTEILWDEIIVKNLRDGIFQSTWLFGKNSTDTPFITSDNPVTSRTADNKMWLKVGHFQNGTYAALPLAPDIIIYMHPRCEKWKSLENFDCKISPVEFNAELVVSENLGHVFMASKFIISNKNNFTEEQSFAPTIGTNIFAPPSSESESESDKSDI